MALRVGTSGWNSYMGSVGKDGIKAGNEVSNVAMKGKETREGRQRVGIGLARGRVVT